MKRVPPGVKAVGLTHAALDLTDESALWSALESYSPEAVINAAAYTAVDRAETESAAAFAVNARAPELIAHWCRMRAVPFIHFGTDYVFDGTKTGPIRKPIPFRPLTSTAAVKPKAKRPSSVKAAPYCAWAGCTQVP